MMTHQFNIMDLATAIALLGLIYSPFHGLDEKPSFTRKQKILNRGISIGLFVALAAITHYISSAAQ